MRLARFTWTRAQTSLFFRMGSLYLLLSVMELEDTKEFWAEFTLATLCRMDLDGDGLRTLRSLRK